MKKPKQLIPDRQKLTDFGEDRGRGAARGKTEKKEVSRKKCGPG